MPFLLVFWHPHTVLWPFRSPSNLGICSISLFMLVSLMGSCGGMEMCQMSIALCRVALTMIAWSLVSMWICCWGMSFLTRIETPSETLFPFSFSDCTTSSVWIWLYSIILDYYDGLELLFFLFLVLCDYSASILSRRLNLFLVSAVWFARVDTCSHPDDDGA